MLGRRHGYWLTWILGLWMLLGSTGLQAQTDDEANGAVIFNFSTPGARSLAMGGAFLGSTDDASAAYSNPAGLLQLSEPEVAVEGRRWRYSVPFADRGRAAGSPTGNGVDTLSSVELGRAESELSGVSFASVVYPRPKWAGAVFFHQVAEFETAFETGGIFSDNHRLFPVRSRYSLDISHAGLAYARKWGNRSTFGLSVSGYKFKLDSLTQRFDPSDFFAPPDFSRDSPVNFQTQSGDANGLGFSLGWRWDLTPKTSVGLVYRFGPEFDMRVRSEAPSPEVPPAQREVSDDASLVFNLPDVAGLGFSFRPSQALTISLDFDQVQYSELIEEFYLIFEEVSDRRVDVEDFVLEDVTEVHLGVEYIFANRWAPVALRAGAWYDPDHRLRAETGPELNQARLPAGDDEVHVSVGLGLNFGSRFQLDLAADFSELYDTAAVSAVYRF